MALYQLYEPELGVAAWYDPTATVAGWLDNDFTTINPATPSAPHAAGQVTFTGTATGAGAASASGSVAFTGTATGASGGGGGSLTPTNLSSSAASSTNGITSSAFTPTASALLVVSWVAEWDGPAGTPTITDSVGLTWTNVFSGTDFGYYYMGVWYALAPSSPSSMTVTVTGPAATGTRRHAMLVDQVAGCDTTTPVPQSVANDTAYSASIPVVLGSTPAASSL